MTAKTRDDFTQPVKNTLAARTGYACSNPDCRGATSGPQADEQKAVNVGVAAHITAASNDGPRYDPNLTSDQRASIINGIWMCQTCAHKIDADQTRYSIGLLYHWKLGGEHAAHQEIGKPKAGTLPVSGNQLPIETIRMVQDKNGSNWSMGTNGAGSPLMFVNFRAKVTEISGKQTNIVAAEISQSAKQAEHILICNGHYGIRPQYLRPNETANLSVTFMIPPVSDLQPDGTWESTVVLVDQFGNRHEQPACVFRTHPLSKS